MSSLEVAQLLLMQDCVMQRLALAMQQRQAQGHPATASETAQVDRTNSSKVPWLVVGPDGIELAIAHKVRTAPSSNNTDSDAAKTILVRIICLQTMYLGPISVCACCRIDSTDQEATVCIIAVEPTLDTVSWKIASVASLHDHDLRAVCDSSCFFFSARWLTVTGKLQLWA